jgi:hypothetical protein
MKPSDHDPSAPTKFGTPCEAPGCTRTHGAKDPDIGYIEVSEIAGWDNRHFMFCQRCAWDALKRGTIKTHPLHKPRPRKPWEPEQMGIFDAEG